jgi:hypothetical protein
MGRASLDPSYRATHHDRAYSGHPSLSYAHRTEDVDARDKREHDV